MNQFEIERILKMTLPPIPTRVLAADEIGTIRFPGAYVINTDPSFKSGRHWIALYVDERQVWELFDSLGRNHYPFLTDNIRERNKEIWQPLGSSTCGEFCVFFLWHRSRGWSLSEFESRYWCTDLETNQGLVECFMTDIYESL